MATVPQYTRQVSPQITPMPYQDLKVNGDMFGENIYKAQEKLGDAMTDFTSMMVDIKKRVDDTKIVEMTNRHHEWVQANLYDETNGYLYKTGKDAYGMSESLMKDYDRVMNEYLSKSGLSPAALARAKATYIKQREGVESQITHHDFEQGVVWSNSEAETGKNNYVNNAVIMRNNPDEINKSIVSGYQLIEWQGEIQHKDAAAIQAEKLKYRSDVHVAVLSSLIGEGSLKANEYFEKHKGEISPDKLPQIINAINNNEINYKARSTAAGLLNYSTEDAYKYIDGIEDINLRDATEREYNRYLKHQEEIQKQYDIQASNEIMQQVFQLKDSGESLSEIVSKVNASNMSLETKEKILNNLKKMQEMEQYGNAWADYNYLRDLASTDHEAFLKITPATYNLTKEQYDDIIELQRKGKDIPYSSAVQLESIANKFDKGFNWFTQHEFDSSEYKRELIDFLSLLEKKQGKAFDINHIDEGQLSAIAAGLGYKNPLEQNKNIDEVKELWMRAKRHGDFKSVLAGNYQAFKTLNKREPNPDEMYELAKRSYNWIETEYQQRGEEKLTNTETLVNNINKTASKKGETKALTYLADTSIPAIGRKLGVKYTYVEGARYRKGDKGNHGKGLSLDVSMSEHPNLVRTQSYEEFAALPHVKTIGTSDPIILKQYAGTAKIKDLTAYDKTHGTNHKNHMHITVDEQYGGTEQGK